MNKCSIRLFAYGGQGMKMALQKIVAPVLGEIGYFTQAFPFFGGERRGAVVSGYLRFSTDKITTHSFITEPDISISFDERIPFDAVTAGLPAGKFLLLNTALPARYAQAAMDRKVYTLNAKDISVSHGIAKPEDPFPLINSAMAGAFFKLFEYITGRTVPDELTRRIFEGALPVKTDENFLAFSDAKRLVQPLAASETPGEYPVSLFRVTQPNGLCTKCRLCYIFCSKRAISLTDSEVHIINEAKCNLCGVCIKLCPRNAISFETSEREDTR
ncbi:MAG: hypothetical protein A3H69_00345 [Candidatus Sungbacteria bacterium RIFCSPLOWO2_02_FULL_47_9]|uniref:4Fe-4S ferredoxin-type domain-containing protein n=1 Tax=Candidatus Sungbacteria bacterium RIFCSPHIGHO2_01_FULL_47_32 TaxID=1802264 RepID=A0A1G2K6R3_9BACT|nr:MAG: hypothetical protein A2633_02940 [Candidatus Sungbacteria bacterium RIFCSPHIGHO2_01_FULL_47_32]OHA00012.1 MAG: hypothetical protein A3D57_03745 [Candidatus Sungbacteria bacterium RIFCSPHIGHO2_02_FULL_46_12]OHA06256.1 MAG: hypothetical protein A3A28_02065 [Candidatus Sungbacteria bacterium RIFCSPLOWO2_01_FULL_47_32]OHA09783.1 MAG: hypothetical protein A3H69_00345 [Candidatus Sungbacteria bacterium RIFCSPLOWO2_02_FULL_47_9]